MTPARTALLALCLVLGMGDRVAAQPGVPQAFHDRIFAVAPLGRFPTDSRAFSGLSPMDKHDVAACRDVLMGLLDSLQTGGDALQYLTPEFAGQYKTTGDVLTSLMAPVRSLMAAGITTFDFVDERTGIELRFFVLAQSEEGTLVVSQQAAVFRKVGSKWRVAGFV
jgi:hypothetical protein